MRIPLPSSDNSVRSDVKLPIWHFLQDSIELIALEMVLLYLNLKCLLLGV